MYGKCPARKVNAFTDIPGTVRYPVTNLHHHIVEHMNAFYNRQVTNAFIPFKCINVARNIFKLHIDEICTFASSKSHRRNCHNIFHVHRLAWFFAECIDKRASILAGNTHQHSGAGIFVCVVV